jgi:hypothetical protein
MPITTSAAPYGYRSELIDPITPEERGLWVEQVRQFANLPGFYGQLIDVRRSKPNPQEIPRILEAMEYVRSHGLLRSAVIVSTATVALSIKQMAWRTGMYEWERYFDASHDADWEQHATDWIVHRIDPDA